MSQVSTLSDLSGRTYISARRVTELLPFPRSVRQVQRWMESGALRSIKVGHQRKTTPEWVEEFVLTGSNQ